MCLCVLHFAFLFFLKFIIIIIIIILKKNRGERIDSKDTHVSNFVLIECEVQYMGRCFWVIPMEATLKNVWCVIKLK